MSLSKEELIQKLEVISSLHHNAMTIQRKMSAFEPQDTYERKIKVPVFPGKYESDYDRDELEESVDHTDDDAIAQMSNAYDRLYHPKEPAKPKKSPFVGAKTSGSQEKQMKWRLISYIGLGVAIFFLLGALVGTADTPEALPPILIIAAIGAAAFFGGRYLEKKEKAVEEKLEKDAKEEYDRQMDALDRQYENDLKQHEEACKAYRLVRQAFLDEYAAWRNIYLQHVKEEADIEAKLEATRVQEVARMEKEQFIPVLEELAKHNDLVTVEYLPALDKIIDLIRSGRADDLKEAINLYEDIVYREKQLQLEREREEQRRYEEEMRREDEERRHREDMAQREAAERQRRSDEERRRREDEQRQRQEEERRQKQERDRQDKEKRDAKSRCHWCKNYHNCGIKYNPPLNCTGFVPSSTHTI